MCQCEDNPPYLWERCGVGLANVWGKKIPTLESLLMPLTIKESENGKPREK